MNSEEDTLKQPYVNRDCREPLYNHYTCPNMEDVGGGFDGERYFCNVCGYSYFLDYEEMK